MLRILRHPNIVEFHTAFTLEAPLQARPTLLFGEADHDLKEWLRGKPSITFSDIETAEALYGLSSALYQVHQYTQEDSQSLMIGCHFDLHPGNILVRGLSFILSDFGLSRLKYEAQGSQSYFKGGVRDYYAPECQQWDGDFQEYKVGRPSDIWSFGCIIAEIATVLKHGSEGLHSFDSTRLIAGAFGRMGTFHNRGQSHEGVSNWLKDLGHDPTSGIIEGLVTLARSMLDIDPINRPNAREVSARLSLLSLKFRYCDTVECFKGLLYSTTDYGWRIEYHRLQLWAKQIGLHDLSAKTGETVWHMTQSPEICFEKVRYLLLHVKQELDDLQHDIDSLPRQHNNLRLRSLRKSIDGLWQTLGCEVIVKLNRALESFLLADADIELPQMARYLPEDSRPQLLLAIKQALVASHTDLSSEKSFQVDPSMISGHREWQERLLGMSDIPGQGSEHLLTEFLKYDDSWIGRSEELVTRINGLVAVLKESRLESNFPVLSCKRFCHRPDRQAYGLIYEIPKQFAINGCMAQPLNLAELIKKTALRSKCPALGEVFKLAYTLAEFILSFHKVGWLHKGISAYNMIFFPSDPGSPGDSLETVRLIGFNYSRESDEGVSTEGPPDNVYIRGYQHPTYRDDRKATRFRNEFGYYSVGIVLLELGRWKSLRSMMAEKKTEASPQRSWKIFARRGSEPTEIVYGALLP